jgi:hypothetical protein
MKFLFSGMGKNKMSLLQEKYGAEKIEAENVVDLFCAGVTIVFIRDSINFESASWFKTIESLKRVWTNCSNDPNCFWLKIKKENLKKALKDWRKNPSFCG